MLILRMLLKVPYRVIFLWFSSDSNKNKSRRQN